MNKKNTIIMSIVVILISLFAIFVSWKNKIPMLAVANLPLPVIKDKIVAPLIFDENTLKKYVGLILSNIDGNNVYTNNKYGFSFTFPQGWRVGDNHLGYGTFQIFNYPESQAMERGGFPTNSKMNKIEAGISDSSAYEISLIYPEATRTIKNVVISGQNSVRTEIELVGGEKILSYSIPLFSIDNQFLVISIYGDPSNFVVIDNLVKSINFF